MSEGGSGANGHVEVVREVNKRIRLIVRACCIPQAQQRIDFLIKKNMSLRKLRKSFSEKIGVPVWELKFFYKGMRIYDATPGELGMEPEDEIQVCAQQVRDGEWFIRGNVILISNL